MISKNINNRRIGKNKNLQDIITPRMIFDYGESRA